MIRATPALSRTPSWPGSRPRAALRLGESPRREGGRQVVGEEIVRLHGLLSRIDTSAEEEEKACAEE